MNQADVSTSAPPEPVAGQSEWTGGRIAAIVIGSLIGLLGIVLLGAGGTGLWAHWTQRDDGYATTDVHEFSTAGAALTTKPAELGSAGVGWLYGPGLLDKIRVRVTPAGGSAPLFVGIGRSADVDAYLSGVGRTVITEFWEDKAEPVAGRAPGSAPGTQDFWVASSTGPGPRTVVWEPTDGSWSVVVMNADGRAGVDIGADLGARVPALPWIGLGLLIAGAVFIAGAVLLIAGAVRKKES